jgi:Cu/Ag efflux protein CusF
MNIDRTGFVRRAATTGAALIALAVTATPISVSAQGMPAISRSERQTATATVKSIDKATRHVTLTRFSLKAPDDVRNLDQLKVGDTITATYVRETEFVISEPNAPAAGGHRDGRLRSRGQGRTAGRRRGQPHRGDRRGAGHRHGQAHPEAGQPTGR